MSSKARRSSFSTASRVTFTRSVEAANGYTWRQGVAIATATFGTASGGNGTYALSSVTPPLPVGLAIAFSGATLQVTGTPTVAGVSTLHTIIITDTSHSVPDTMTTVEVRLTVVVASINQAVQPWTQNTTITPFIPVVGSGGQTPYTYGVAPALPTGMSMASGTGTVSGTPTIAITPTAFSVTVTDSVGGAGGSAVNSFTASVTAQTVVSYSTSFPLTENPMSETGAWIQSTVFSPTNPAARKTAVQTSGGNAFGTMSTFDNTNFIDSSAIVAGWSGANQEITCTIANNGAVSGIEIELLLRGTVTASSLTAYEVDCFFGGKGIALTRWDFGVNTPNQFVTLRAYVPNETQFNNGDQVYANIIGTLITVKYKAGAGALTTLFTYDTVNDSIKYSSGAPGIGFWNQTGSSANSSKLAWSDFLAAPASVASNTLLADWTARSTAAGVVQAIRFTSSAVVTQYTHVDGTGTNANVVFNSVGGIIGDGCLRINEPAGWAGAATGAWRIPMNASWTNGTPGFGSGDWYLQFRVKLAPGTISVDPGTDEGFKIANFSEYNFTSPNSSRSHMANEIVLQQQGDLSGVPIAYHDLAAVGGNSAARFTVEGFPTPSDIQHQTSVDNGAGISDKFARYCLYEPSQTNAMSPGCFRWQEGIWYTIDIHVKVAVQGGTDINNIFEYAITPDGGTKQQLYSLNNQLMSIDVDLPNGVNGAWFLAYKTNRSSVAVGRYREYDQIIFSTQPIAAPGSLPAWVPTTLGAWTVVANTSLSLVPPSPAPPGSPSAKIDNWCSLAASRTTGKVYSVAGGGHTDYSGNEVDCIDLVRTSPNVVQLLAPTASPSDSAYYPDGRPASRHSYYGVWFDETANRVVICGGSRWNSGALDDNVDFYNVSSNSYQAGGVAASVVTGGSDSEAKVICMNPLTGDVYMFANNNGVRWNRATNTFSGALNPTGAGVPYCFNAPSAFDTTRNRMLAIGGPQDICFTYDVSANSITNHTLTGTNIVSGGGMYEGSLVYVPAVDKFFARLPNAGGGTVYQIDPVTFACTVFATTGGTSIPATAGNGVYNRFLYIPVLKGIFFMPIYSQNGWFLRVHS